MEGYLFIFLTVVFWGVTALIDKVALKHAVPLQGLFIRSCAVFVVIVTSFFVTGLYKGVQLLPRRTIFLFLLSGLLAGGLGMFTYYGALKRLPSSLVVPLCATYPLLTAVLAVVFLKEELSLLRFLGIIFIIVGIWMVK